MTGIFPTLYPFMMGFAAFIVTTLTLFEVECVDSQNQAMKRQDQAKTFSVIATISTASVVECALECQRNPLCTDIAHNRAAETCQLLGRKKDRDSAKFIKPDDQVSVFTNIQEASSGNEGN